MLQFIAKKFRNKFHNVRNYISYTAAHSSNQNTKTYWGERLKVEQAKRLTAPTYQTPKALNGEALNEVKRRQPSNIETPKALKRR